MFQVAEAALRGCWVKYAVKIHTTFQKYILQYSFGNVSIKLLFLVFALK